VQNAGAGRESERLEHIRRRNHLLVQQHLGRGGAVGQAQVVVEAREFDTAGEAAAHHLGADAPAAHEQPLIHEFLDGAADGRTGDREMLGELEFVLDPRSGSEVSPLDGLLHPPGDLVVEGDRPGAVEVHEEFFCGNRHQALSHGRRVVDILGTVSPFQPITFMYC
jgi:hypothetical protein